MVLLKLFLILVYFMERYSAEVLNRNSSKHICYGQTIYENCRCAMSMPETVCLLYQCLLFRLAHNRASYARDLICICYVLLQNVLVRAGGDVPALNVLSMDIRIPATAHMYHIKSPLGEQMFKLTILRWLKLKRSVPLGCARSTTGRVW